MEEMILTDLTELLGGAQRGRTRVHAFPTWSPREETLALLARVNAGEQPKLLITTIFPLDPSPSNAVAAP